MLTFYVNTDGQHFGVSVAQTQLGAPRLIDSNIHREREGPHFGPESKIGSDINEILNY